MEAIPTIHLDADKVDKLERLTQALENQQLSLDVGGEAGAYIVSEFKIAGKSVSPSLELARESRVLVQIVDEDGEILQSLGAWVSQVGFETIPASDRGPKHTVRRHTIALD